MNTAIDLTVKTADDPRGYEQPAKLDEASVRVLTETLAQFIASLRAIGDGDPDSGLVATAGGG